MKRLLDKIRLRLYALWALWYIGKDRNFQYAGIRLRIPSGVFHPGVFFSTPVFVDFLQTVEFHGKTVLDVGAGSGLLALYAAKRGAIVTAIDINPLAVETCRQNALQNGIELNVIQSDLFDNLQGAGAFDFLLINPPYYAADAENDRARAFFAGKNLEYFSKLFRQMHDHIHPGTQIWMILSDNCDLTRIGQIAETNGFHMSLVHQRIRMSKPLLIYTCGRV